MGNRRLLAVSGCNRMKLARAIGLLSRALLVLVLVGLFCQLAHACPGCKDALAENDPHHARMVSGYFWSILFMMGMPFALVGTFGAYCYLEVRRRRFGQQGSGQLGSGQLGSGEAEDKTVG